MFTSPFNLPEMAAHHIEDERAKFLKLCKDTMWKHRTREYLQGLRERHNLQGGIPPTLAVGDMVIIKSDERNRGKCPLSIVTELYPGHYGVMRAARLRLGKSYLDQVVQQLYPLELSCDRTVQTHQALNTNAPAFSPVRNTAIAARQCIPQTAEDEQ